jgi:Fic-DOC domain mobile mystery protein B
LDLEYPPGATPLDPNESDGLIPDYITTQGELNLLERANIIQASDWAQRRQKDEVLNVTFLLELHRRMFGEVWRWAGKARKTDKNIGAPHVQIFTGLAVLLDDVKYWVANSTFSWDEIGARFHHRLVAIHIFPNGNGRHSRLMTDLLLTRNAQQPFSWGQQTSPNELDKVGDLRTRYIEALKQADKGNYEPLIGFVRS